MTWDTYITALAWILGAIGVVYIYALIRTDDTDDANGCTVWMVFFAWAWLIGRYLKRWL